MGAFAPNLLERTQSVKQFFFLFVLLLALSLSVTAHADTWDDFQNFNNNYYMIDKAAKGEITCRIRSSSLDELMSNVPAIGNVLADQIDRFSVSVRPDGTVRFVTPRTNMPFGTFEGAEMATKMLADTVAETKRGVWDVIENAMTPRKDQVRDLSMGVKDGKTHVSLSALNMDGDWVKLDVTSSGDTDTVTQTEGKDVLESDNKYTKVDGKLILSTQTMHSHRTEGVIDQAVKVKYQQIGQVWFPAQIVADAHIGAKLKPAHAEVNLTDCTGH